MKEKMKFLLTVEDQLFVPIIMKFWDKEQTLEEWVDLELSQNEHQFLSKYGELRFLVKEALEAEKRNRDLL